MRQANSAIKGFLYQFDKSLHEILSSGDGDIITLEGQIEDIDIISTAGTEAIQCKYHEGDDFTISKVAEPILEMFCHYIRENVIGKKTKYVLYAYFQTNVEIIEHTVFHDFVMKTVNRDIIKKYFTHIFNICDAAILDIANKTRKTKDETNRIYEYFISDKNSRTYKIPIEDFFSCFTYRTAERHDRLKSSNIKLLENIANDGTIASSLYYPNAFTKVATMSSIADISKRKITKAELLSWLLAQHSLIANKWMFAVSDRKKVLKQQKTSLSSTFANNSDVRAFIFSSSFIKNNESGFINYFIEYTKKYYCKKSLQKPPIFIFDSDDTRLIDDVTVGLFSYQLKINNGRVGNKFVPDSFIENTNSSSDFSMKLALLTSISEDILQRCGVNYLYHIGNQPEPLISQFFRTEPLGITSLAELKYLVKIDTTLTEV